MRLVPVIRRAGLDFEGDPQGQSRGGASRMILVISGMVSSTSSSGTSNISSSCTCNSICACSFERDSASSMRIMARRIMSAAEPWIGALIAWRSTRHALIGIAGADRGIMAGAPENGGDIAVLAAIRLGLLHVIPDAGKPLEILLDIGARLLAPDPEPVGEAESRNAVDDAEIDGLGAAAVFAGHLGEGDVKHFRRGRSVNVDAVGEGFA